MFKIGKLEIKSPFFLAPMAGVTDHPFRLICRQYGAGVVYTEFVSANGIIRENLKTLEMMRFTEEERPLGIQIFGDDPEVVGKSAKMVNEMFKPDLIDINYGCPVKKVACKGAGAGILLDLDKMQKMTAEIVKQVNIPVTVKTRLGWDENSIKIVEVAERLQDVGIQALTIHGRTRKQMYKGTANWDYIAKVKNNPRINIPIFGNGDIDSPEKANEYKEKYGVDGIMIGRAAIGNPWIFNQIKSYIKDGTFISKPNLEERINVVKKHLEFSIKWKGEKLGLIEMRRHYTNYFRAIENFKEYRMKLILSESLDYSLNVLDEISEVFNNKQVSAST